MYLITAPFISSTEIAPYSNQSSIAQTLIQDRLSQITKGQMNVMTPAGTIDILTDTEMIIIEEMKNWKDAVGKLICYEDSYPTHMKTIYLYGECSVKDEVIYKVCKKYDINVILLV